VLGGQSAVVLFDAHATLVQGNHIGVGADGVTPLRRDDWGVELDYGAGDNVIRGNDIGYTRGVFLGSLSANLIDGNRIHDSSGDGVVIWSVPDNAVTNNDIYGNARHGILMLGTRTPVTGNSVHDNAGAGILVDNVVLLDPGKNDPLRLNSVYHN